VSIFPPLTFPDLRILLKTLLEGICNGTTRGSDELPYRDEIFAHGGVSSTVEQLMDLVLPEVLGLRGEPISPDRLNTIRVFQRENTPWGAIAGYLDYVTDVRHADYLRNYVGQSALSERRILRQHVQSILGGSYASLQYFIIWLGNGHRTASFIQLWSFPVETDTGEQWYRVRANILELLFCTAFGGHHDDQTGPGGIGLNVVSPLVQGAGKWLEHSKLLAGEAMSRSPDPQIRFWTPFRWERKAVANRPPISKRPLFVKDFNAALEGAFGDKKLVSALTASLCSPTAVDGASRALPDINAIGTSSSRIGIVLDYAFSNPAITEICDVDSVETSSAESCFPWPLPSCGLTVSNAAVWTFDFKSFSALNAARLQDEPAADKTHITDRHRSLIAASQLKIILLCGPRAESSLRAVIRDTTTYTLELRGFRYRMYLDDVTDSSRSQSQAKRLFIRSPELPAKGSTLNSTRSTQLSELIRFAVNLVGLQETCTPYYIESNNAIATICKLAYLERRGYPKMTTKTLDDGIRLWLARKGISEEQDIHALKELAGSLTWGLLMLLSALPRQQKEAKTSRGSGKRNRLNVQFNAAVFAEVRQRVSELVASRNEEYDRELSKLQPDKRSPHLVPSSSDGSHGVESLLLSGRGVKPVEEEDNRLGKPREGRGMAIEASASNRVLEPEEDDELDNLLEACAIAMETPSADRILKSEEEYESSFEPSVSDPAILEAAKSSVVVTKGQRAKRTEIPRIPVELLDGSRVHINKSGTLMLRVYCGTGGDRIVNVNVRLGSRFVPQDETRRTIHFTQAGIDIRDSKGNTIINSNATTDVASIPRDRLDEYADGTSLIRLWESITGSTITSSRLQQQLPRTTQKLGKAPQQGDALWTLNEFLNEHFPRGGEYWTGSRELYPDSTEDNKRFLE